MVAPRSTPPDGPIAHHGDCIEWLRSLDGCSVDAIVTDPPYGLGFMGKTWDKLPPGREWSAECLRVLKPGGHLIAFGGTRTVHRLVCSVEDAGFEIRDSIGWLYFSGFAKNLDVAKAIATGGRPEDIRRAAMGDAYVPSGRGRANYDHGSASAMNGVSLKVDGPGRGLGTALKPAIEPATLARKPLGGTVARNYLEWGTGVLNIDACRFAPGDPAWVGPNDDLPTQHGAAGGQNGLAGTSAFQIRERPPGQTESQQIGRWPANIYYHPKPSRRERERGLNAEVMLCSCPDTREEWANEDQKAATNRETAPRARKGTTGSTSADASGWPTSSSGSDTTGLFPAGSTSTTSTKTSRTTGSKTSNSSIESLTSGCIPDASSEMASGGNRAGSAVIGSPSDPNTGTSPGKDGPCTGDADRATSRESSWKNSSVVPGLRVCKRCGKWDRQPSGSNAVAREEGSAGMRSPRAGSGRTSAGIWCVHPTVKPVGLMRWLCRLVCPPGGLVIDPFLGSGTTGIAATLEGFRFAGAEREDEYVEIARARMAHAFRYPEQWEPGARAPRTKRARRTDVVDISPAQGLLFGGAR